MKHMMLRFFLIVSIVTNSSFCNPLLVVVLMVKNEAAAMRSTLQPFVDAGVDSFLILDTGSTDNTIAVTEQFFKEHAIEHGVVAQQPFIDFATSRNYALQCAQGTFQDATFLLMADAEWQMHNVTGLLRFCADHTTDPCNSYLVRTILPSLDFFTPRLIRAQRGVQFVGVVHEVLNQISHKRVNSDVFFNVCTTQYGREKSQQRWLRDKDMLLQEYNRNPHDPRTLFYLAQTCACMGDWENACFYYTLRCAINGWDEENFMAHYKLAQAYESQNLWSSALHYYLKASAVRPWRAEPLIRVANYYLAQKKYALGFLFAQRAVNIAYPLHDVLFIEKDLYDYMRYDILGQCAWFMGEFAIGQAAVEQALLAQPDAPHLQNNLRLYAGISKNA